MIIFLSYIFYFIASSAYSLQVRWLTKKRDLESREQILFIFELSLAMFIGSLFFPFFSPFYLTGNYFYLFLLALICGVFGIGVSLFSIFAQKHIDAGVTTLVGNIYTPITIFLSSIFLYEGLNNLQILGTVLLLVSVLIVSKKHRIGKFSFDKYFLYMVLSGVLLGFLLVAERALMKTTGFSAGIIISWGSQALGLGLVAIFTKSKRIYTKMEVATTGLIRFFSALSYVILVNIVANMSLVVSITTFKIVIMFIAGALFLGEREDVPRKIIGSIVAVLGLLLMK